MCSMSMLESRHRGERIFGFRGAVVYNIDSLVQSPLDSYPAGERASQIGSLALKILIIDGFYLFSQLFSLLIRD